MDFEIGHINLSVKSERDTQKEREEIESQKRLFEEDEGIAGCPWEDDKPIVGWHTDSYPFVCVLMLSDCTDMVGGETALCTGDGDLLKVRGPQMVRNNFSINAKPSNQSRVARLFFKADISIIRPFERLVLKNESLASHHSAPRILMHEMTQSSLVFALSPISHCCTASSPSTDSRCLRSEYVHS
jgi:hypothetical protein